MNKIDVGKAVEIIKSGGVIIFPTDTVYGMGTRADDPKAVERLYKIKGTPRSQQFPQLISKVEQVEKIAYITPLAKNLIRKYWPGALTIVLKPKAGSQKIGFRQPDDPMILKIIEGLNIPIIGTSANFHKEQAPHNIEEVDSNLLGKADLVIEGSCPVGVESTVVDASGNRPKILRQGAIKI